MIRSNGKHCSVAFIRTSGFHPWLESGKASQDLAQGELVLKRKSAFSNGINAM